MHFFLANPAGLWALLSLPAILAIHFLQERAQRVRVSTLFLLEHVWPESVGGMRWERLRQSLALWMQLLAALLITWMLSEPRWIRQDASQTLVVVLDSSVSMSAFKKETRALLDAQLSRWARRSHETVWHLIESDRRKPTLYVGQDLRRLLEAFDGWQPSLGDHSPDEALLTARELTKNRQGVVVFVTDRKVPIASDIAILSAGHPLDNVGFAGLTLPPQAPGETVKWRALVKNYGHTAQQKQWWIEPSHPTSAEPEKRPITLEPGQTVVLEGSFAEKEDRLTLVLTPDAFTTDDRMPIQRPQLRTLTVDLRVGGPSGDLLRKMLGALDAVQLQTPAPTDPPADVTITEIGAATTGNAIQIAGPDPEGTELNASPTIAEDHPLTRDLNWIGLLTAKPQALLVGYLDEPLLWKGDQSLALIRNTKKADGHRQRRLLLNWDLANSNAAHWPAVLIMLQRFFAQERLAKSGHWADNFETGQSIPMAPDTSATKAPITLKYNGKTTPFEGHSPENPVFFTVERGGPAIVTGAAHFADTRQADFSNMEPLNTLEDRAWQAALNQSESDALIPLWLVLTLGCLMLSWYRRQRPGLQTEPDLPPALIQSSGPAAP